MVGGVALGGVSVACRSDSCFPAPWHGEGALVLALVLLALAVGLAVKLWDRWYNRPHRKRRLPR
jgi:hypothetical protein